MEIVRNLKIDFFIVVVFISVSAKILIHEIRIVKKL